jgi:hypothetical protein
MKSSVLLLTITMLFTGCQKLIDRYSTHWGLPPSVGTCRVDSIYPVEKGSTIFNLWTAVGVHYNGKGYPVQANYSINHYGLNQFPVYYRYDNKNRLIEVVPEPTDAEADFLYTAPLHVKYVYDGDSRVPVRDTIFSWLYQVVEEVEDLYYDEKGRIIRVVHRDARYPFPESYETKYEYDANGNKQVTQAADGTTPAPIEYSTRPSLYSLHHVWQLIHKDYSKNAVKSNVDSFNERGFPLKVDLATYYNKNVEGSFYSRPFLCVETGPDFTLSYITYNCPQLVNPNWNGKP